MDQIQEVMERDNLAFWSLQHFHKKVEFSSLRPFNSSPELHTFDKRSDPEFPCFKADDNTEVPRVCVWQILNRDDSDDIMYMSECERIEFFEGLLKSYELPDDQIPIVSKLLSEVAHWCVRNDFGTKKLSSLIGIFYITHMHFVNSDRRNHEDTYNFFRESILDHSLTHPPKCARIFEPPECKAALLLFCNLYLSLLPLIRLLIIPSYRLQIKWTVPEIPESKKKKSISKKKEKLAEKPPKSGKKSSKGSKGSSKKKKK